MAPKPPKPVKPAKGVSVPPLTAPVAASDPPDPLRRRLVSARRLLDQLGGAKLCYGEPVVAGDRTVIPVARLRAAGGGGFGSGGEGVESGTGGGGGGNVDALPMGFIEIGPEGTRFERIDDPERTMRTVKAAASAVATIVTTVAGARAVRGRRALPRGR